MRCRRKELRVISMNDNISYVSNYYVLEIERLNKLVDAQDKMIKWYEENEKILKHNSQVDKEIIQMKDMQIALLNAISMRRGLFW